jgi:hypothetical protein
MSKAVARCAYRTERATAITSGPRDEGASAPCNPGGSNTFPRADNGFNKLIGRLGIAAGMPFPIHPHMLRHARGFKLANDGHDTRSLQHWHGHKNIVTPRSIRRCRRIGSKISGADDPRARSYAVDRKHDFPVGGKLESTVAHFLESHFVESIGADSAHGFAVPNGKISRSPTANGRLLSCL